MRVLFIFNLATTNPLFLELVHRLKLAGYSVLVYDFISSKIYDPVVDRTYPINSYWWAPCVLRIKYIRRLFIPYINRKCISKEFMPGDIVHVHYVHKEYSLYAKQIKELGCRLITTFWGSDYLRASYHIKMSYHNLLVNSDVITMVEGVKSIFNVEFPEYKHKTRTTFFGLKLLDLIKEVTEEDIVTFKKKHNVSLLKKVVAIGYNGSPAQQHLKVVNVLRDVKDELKEGIHLFIPITYGGDLAYIADLKTNVEQLDMSFTFFEERLSDRDMAILRCSSEIVINIQETDAFSGALSESLAAGNLLIVGDWLPYDIYNQWGVIIKRCSEKELLHSIETSFNQLESWPDHGSNNKRIINNKLTWESTLKNWIAVYNFDQ